MKTNRKIYVFHLLNDFSGSPKVLSQILKRWVAEGKEVHLTTSTKNEGFLSHIDGIHYHNNQYIYQKNPYLRLLFFFYAQLITFVYNFFRIKKNDLIYVNTSLPFAGGLAGKLKGAKVIYHIHESTISPRVLKWFLLKIITLTANEIINVSAYVQQQHQITHIKNHLVYNAIDSQFIETASLHETTQEKTDILMICSLKKYKGVMEFIQLARLNPNEKFTLVVNATDSEIDSFFTDTDLPQNIDIFSAQKNVHPFYARAKVVMNLSRPDGWIETFGLTVIEAMAYKIPVIVPPVGGIVEVIDDQNTGFAVDSRNIDQVQEKLSTLLHNTEIYQSLALNAFQRLSLFTEQQFHTQIAKIAS